MIINDKIKLTKYNLRTSLREQVVSSMFIAPNHTAILAPIASGKHDFTFGIRRLIFAGNSPLSLYLSQNPDYINVVKNVDFAKSRF